MQRALKAWDSMSHEQRETQARAMRISLALREKLCVLQQLHDELIEDAIETQKGASQLEDKLRRRVLPLLDECETGLRRVKDELRLGRETTDTLAGLLRDTTRALLEAPIESVKMVKRRVPSMFAIALTRWINKAQGSGIDLDTVFHEVKKIGKSASTDGKSKDDGGKRKRAETSEDCGEDGSERVGEGPSGGTHIHIRDLSGRVNGDVGVEARDSLEDDEVLSTTELPNNADGSQVPVSGIAAAKTQGKNVNQNSNALTSSSADHTVSPTEQNNIQAPGPTTLATRLLFGQNLHHLALVVRSGICPVPTNQANSSRFQVPTAFLKTLRFPSGMKETEKAHLGSPGSCPILNSDRKCQFRERSFRVKTQRSCTSSFPVGVGTGKVRHKEAREGFLVLYIIWEFQFGSVLMGMIK